MMPCKAQVIFNIIESIAPKVLAQEWDNVGLLIGDYSKDVNRLLLCLDVSESVVEEAIFREVDLIVSHHPVVFNQIKNIRTDLPLGRLVYKIVKNNLSVYSVHTNFDAAENSMVNYLAGKMGLSETEVLIPVKEDPLKKVVVYVPEGYENKIIEVIGEVGAGFIGHYSHCTFRTFGTGTFKPLQGTNPFIGSVGKLENVKEYRIETIVQESKLKKLLLAILKVHPYEEVAYDVYPLENKGVKIFGFGRIGKLKNSMSLREYANYIKEILNINCLKIVGDMDKKIKKVALLNGSGSDAIYEAYFKGADVLVTGDVSYHKALDARNLGLAVIDAGHFNTEIVFKEFMSNYLKQQFDKIGVDVEILLAKEEDVFKYL